MLRRSGNDRAVFLVTVDANIVAAPGGAPGGGDSIVTVAQAGLLNEVQPTDGVFVGPIRKSGTKPTKISWYYGNATAVTEFTPWQTRWIRFYDENIGGQSHRSTPFSKATGDITSENLRTGFIELFGPTGTVRQRALGERGKAMLTFENAAIRV
jgi:hypothetical protein